MITVREYVLATEAEDRFAEVLRTYFTPLDFRCPVHGVDIEVIDCFRYGDLDVTFLPEITKAMLANPYCLGAYANAEATEFYFRPERWIVCPVCEANYRQVSQSLR